MRKVSRFDSAVSQSINLFDLCLASRYYETDAALQSHWRSKVHKRRLKQLREPAYTIEESERAAGLGRENRRPQTVPSTTMETSVVDAV